MRPAPYIAGITQFVALLMIQPPALSADHAGSTALELLARLEQVREQANVPAMGLVIVRDDRVTLLETRGVKDRHTGEPIRDDAIIRIGSITKMFTGLLAAELAARRVVDLDGPVYNRRMADTYSNSYRETHPVTLAQLLEQTAGFTDMIRPEWDYSDPVQLPLEQTLRMYPEARVTRWPPGVHFSYTNAGAGLAAYFLELTTGKAYEELLAERLLEPAGMTDTSVFPPDSERLAAGYDSDGSSRIPYWHQIFRSFGAINSTLGDMARFIRLFLNRGMLDGERLFSVETIRRVETATTSLAARGGLASGYGLGNYDWLRNGILFHGHGGDADGYLSRMGYTLANDSGYFLFITAFQGSTLRTMTRLVEDYLTAPLQPPELPHQHPVSPAKVNETTGRYCRLTYRFPTQAESAGRDCLMIESSSGKLLVSKASEPVRQLVPTGERQFRWPGQNRASQFIGPGPSGKVYYQDGSDSYIKVRD